MACYVRACERGVCRCKSGITWTRSGKVCVGCKGWALWSAPSPIKLLPCSLIAPLLLYCPQYFVYRHNSNSHVAFIPTGFGLRPAQDIRLRRSIIHSSFISRPSFSLYLSFYLSLNLSPARSSLPFLPSAIAMSHTSHSSDKASLLGNIQLKGPANYNTWCRYVKGKLKVKCLADHITATAGAGATVDKKDTAEWQRQDQRAQGIITLSVSQTMLTVLGDDDLTAKQMWDKLATHCRRQDMWRLVDLFRQLTNTRLLNAASAEQHLATMSDIRTQFVNYGKPVPEWIAALLLLLSVPTDDRRWEVFLASHTAASAATAAASADKDKTPDIKWDAVSAAIMAEASKQAQHDAERARKQETDQTVAAAYAARMHDSSMSDKSKNSKQGVTSS